MSSEARLCCNLSEQKEGLNCRSSISGYIFKYNYEIHKLIIVKTAKKSLMSDYGLSNAIFETLNHDALQSFKRL